MSMEMVDFSPAKWIWTGDNTSKNQKVIFRKKLELSKVPESACAFVSCETKYWLWINGKMVVFEGGVFRESLPGCGYAEKVDLAPFLREGENTFAVLVWFYGNGGRNNVNPGRAGFIIKCGEIGLYSDSSFRAALHPAYVSTRPPYPSYLYGGYNLGFDARLDIGDFTAPGFDDSAFPAASEYDGAAFGGCVLSDLPLLKVYPEEELAFSRTLGGAVAKLPHAMTFTVDFTLQAKGGEVVDIRTDRYSVNGGPGDEHHSYNGHRIEYTCRPGKNNFKSLMYLYGEEVRLSFPETVRPESLSCVESGYDTQLAGRFETDDPVFNRLIEKSVRTLYVCMRNNFMDCPDRERGQWIGDVSVQAPQVFFACDAAAVRLLKKSIRDFIYLRRGDVLVGNTPGENSAELPGQSLVAISRFGLIGEYYHYTLDPEIPGLVTGPAVNYLKLWSLTDDGLLEPRFGDWRWFDHLSKIDEPVLENCLYVGAARYVLELAELTGDKEACAFLRERIAVLSEGIERNFWKGSCYASGDFIDDRANAAAVLAGICPKERFGEIRRVLMTVFNSSPYFERFVMLALCEMGHIDDAYRRMMSRYYDLAMNENSTMWEDFHILGSKNHAWSGCPLEIAFKYFLGLKTDDAFKTFTIDPVPGIFGEIRCAFLACGKKIEKHICFEGGRPFEKETG